MCMCVCVCVGVGVGVGVGVCVCVCVLAYLHDIVYTVFMWNYVSIIGKQKQKHIV